MKEIAKGKVSWKFGDNFNCDNIVAAKYRLEPNPENLAKVMLIHEDPDFGKKFKPGDFFIAGVNYGYTHHTTGLTSFPILGIAALIADSINPNFFRAAIEIGFPIMMCPGISKKTSVGDELEVNFQTGEVKNLTTGATIKAEPMHPILQEIINAGGTEAYTHHKIEALRKKAKKE